MISTCHNLEVTHSYTYTYILGLVANNLNNSYSLKKMNIISPFVGILNNI